MEAKKRVLITGGLGYIGSHSAVELIQQGFEVIIIDNLSNSSLDVLDRIESISGQKPEFHEVDLCDQGALEDCLSSCGKLDAVVHFAAKKLVGESTREPLLYYRNNVGGLINLLAVLDSVGVSNFVFSSSCTVYGQPEILPVTESSPANVAASPYGETKVISEAILSDVSRAKGYNVISLRYFNPVGAHESGDLGEASLHVPENLMPYLMQTALGTLEELTIHGSDYGTADGTCVRDYIHIMDLAAAHSTAVSRLLNNNNKGHFEVFNIGTGKGFSVLDIVNAFQEVIGVALNTKFGPRRAGDIEEVYAATDKAEQELGWKAARGLKEMISSAWKWENNNQDTQAS